MIDSFKERIEIFGFPKLSEENIKFLCDELNVSFSEELIEISNLVDFEYFDAFQIYSLISKDEYSVIGETLRLRKTCKLPLSSLFLFEDDASILLMKCCGDHEEIYWIAVEDFYNYCEGKPLEYSPTIFPTFTDFFEYLLTEEEKARGIIPS